jgi:phosphoglycerate dehydrogenase-like enzyme
LVTIIGMSLPNLDMAAATDNGVIVAHSNFANPIYANVFNATPELTWALMIATVRHMDLESRRMREGKWQSTVGIILAGRTLGLLGLGRIGKRMAAYAHAFGMPVIAWSQNLTDETAASVGARRVEKDDLFRLSDVLSIHVQLSDRTRGLVTALNKAVASGSEKSRSRFRTWSRQPICKRTCLRTCRTSISRRAVNRKNCPALWTRSITASGATASSLA